MRIHIFAGKNAVNSNCANAVYGHLIEYGVAPQNIEVLQDGADLGKAL